MFNKTPGTGKLYIPGLNGLRALSITLVLLNHAFIKGPIDNLTPPLTFFTDGGLGVNIFFVISGCLITTLLMQEVAQTHTISLKNFYMRRVLRIFPAYYFLLLCYAGLQLVNVFQLTATSWLTAITFTKYFDKTDWPTNHLWSLSVEEHFYILWPLLFTFFKNKRNHLLLLIIVVAVPAARVLNTFYYHAQWMDDLSFFQRADAILCGCLLAFNYNKVLAFTNKLLQKTKLFFFLPVAVLFLLYLLNQCGNMPLPLSIIITAFGGTAGTIGNIAIVLLIVFSIGYKTAWYRLLNLRWVNFAGKISYGIYLWQQVFFSKWQQMFFSITLNRPLTLLVNIGCILLVAVFSYYIIEKPFLSLKAKYKTTRQAI